jgi:LmbE family N-acetylglucosaminyl deacetylase
LFRRATAPEGEALDRDALYGDAPRAMLVFAHPDDETVALGARLGRFAAAHFVYVTDGAPRNEQDSRWHGFASWRDYRAARFRELETLLASAGISSATHECLDLPDQEASLHLDALSMRLADLIARHAPEVIFTHPYEGGHPDHDACAFAVHHAVGLRPWPGGQPPLIIEGAFYNAGAGGPGAFLPHPANVPVVEYRLTAQEQQRKLDRIHCFETQRETLGGFPLEWERFRIAPPYDFCLPPHSPPLLYDRHPWGMTSQRFIQLAREAEELLYETKP